MSVDHKMLSAIGWLGILVGGALLGSSTVGDDRTTASALFYIAAAVAYGFRSLRPAHTTNDNGNIGRAQ